MPSPKTTNADDDETSPAVADAGPSTAGDDEFERLLQGVAAAPEVPLFETVELVPGTVVAETYRVESTLGRGGMGAVFRALDLRLHRPVALKVHAGAADPRALDLLRVEAQAMAQLSHPNVVEVFEVGVHDDRLFIAMELVDGGTLRSWQQGRPWADIVQIYLEAGRGLAAAHRAGLVHRDFKPENVLVGRDDRPRVADFGLVLGLPSQRARAFEDSLPEPEAPASPPWATNQTPSGLSTRAIAGTPRYMAPEQKAGRGADPRADQYAFCVALYEALAGEPPDDSAPAPIEAGPPALWRATARGLAPEPDDRHPDMDALLQALTRSLHRRSITPWLVAAAGVTAAGVVASVWTHDDPRAACRDDAHATVATWDPPRARVKARLAEVGEPLAALEHQLDAYTEQWLSLRLRSCETEPDDPRRDASMPCLQAAARAMHGALEMLEFLDPAKLEADRALPLPSLDRCELDATHGPAAPAPAPAIAAEVEAVLADVARSDALIWSGDWDRARALAEAALRRAEPLDYPPAELSARLQVADAALSAGDLKTARWAPITTTWRWRCATWRGSSWSRTNRSRRWRWLAGPPPSTRAAAMGALDRRCPTR